MIFAILLPFSVVFIFMAIYTLYMACCLIWWLISYPFRDRPRYQEPYVLTHDQMIFHPAPWPDLPLAYPVTLRSHLVADPQHRWRISHD